jgi:hypothetical protein
VKERYWSKQNKQTVDLKTWTAKELGFPAFAILFIGNFVKTQVVLKLEIRFTRQHEKRYSSQLNKQTASKKMCGQLRWVFLTFIMSKLLCFKLEKIDLIFRNWSTLNEEEKT